MAWMAAATTASPRGRYRAHRTSLGFALTSVWKAWAAAGLRRGAWSSVAAETTRDADRSLRARRAHRVTVAAVRPTLLAAVIDSARRRDLGLLFCGGEPLPAELVARVASAAVRS
jgi:acyl-coenzyme A synthetase/AMP-(fatty) acid ligase